MNVLDSSPDGGQLLVEGYRSVSDSMLYLVDARSDERRQLTADVRSRTGQLVEWPLHD